MPKFEPCQRCGSRKLAALNAKCSDQCSVYFATPVNVNGEEVSHVEGYLPESLKVGHGDYVSFSWCLECGQVKGDFLHA